MQDPVDTSLIFRGHQQFVILVCSIFPSFVPWLPVCSFSHFLLSRHLSRYSFDLSVCLPACLSVCLKLQIGKCWSQTSPVKRTHWTTSWSDKNTAKTKIFQIGRQHETDLYLTKIQLEQTSPVKKTPWISPWSSKNTVETNLHLPTRHFEPLHGLIRW